MLATYYLIKKSNRTHDETRNLRRSFIKDLSRKCRICLQDGNSSIYDTKDPKIIVKALEIFCNIFVNENDCYTKYLCVNCLQFLKQALTFRKVAQRTEKLLKSTVKTKEDKNQVSATKESTKQDKNQVTDTNESTKQDKNQVTDTKESTKQDKNQVTDTKESTKQDKNQVTDTKESTKQNQDKNQVSDRKESKWLKYKEIKLEETPVNKVTCTICDKVIKSSYYSEHMTTHNPNHKGFICEICGKTFTLRCSYHNHRNRHGTEFPYKCELCPYQARDNQTLKIHNRTHTRDFKYMCTECPARFLVKSNLNRHMRQHREPAFKCDVCSKAFHTKLRLDQHHQCIHLGVRNYDCAVCGKAFGTRRAVMAHQLVVHKRQKLPFGRMPSYLLAKEGSKLNVDSDAKSAIE